MGILELLTMENITLGEFLDHIDEYSMVRVVYGGEFADYDGCLDYDYCIGIDDEYRNLAVTDFYIDDDGVVVWVDYKGV